MSVSKSQLADYRLPINVLCLSRDRDRGIPAAESGLLSIAHPAEADAHVDKNVESPMEAQQRTGATTSSGIYKTTGTPPPQNKATAMRPEGGEAPNAQVGDDYVTPRWPVGWRVCSSAVPGDDSGCCRWCLLGVQSPS